MSFADELRANIKAMTDRMDAEDQFPEWVAVTNDLGRLKEYFKAEIGTDMAEMICGYRVIESEFGQWPYTLLPASVFDKPNFVRHTATESESVQRLAERVLARMSGKEATDGQ